MCKFTIIIVSLILWSTRPHTEAGDDDITFEDSHVAPDGIGAFGNEYVSNHPL
jgi:hypothetical protein